MQRASDVAVVGGGIVGLAVGVAAASRGLSVRIFDRHRAQRGASVRNFGMVWPVGQPQGENLRRALRSREIWLDLAERAGFWASPCGSLHLARAEDERQVLDEFASAFAGPGHAVDLIDADAAQRICPAVRREGLLGALWSRTELAVDPREAVRALTAYLQHHDGVEFIGGELVTSVQPGVLTTPAGRRYEADRILVCSGSDLETLFPHVYAEAPLQKCRLQMMRSTPEPARRLGTHVAGGLTLRHYAAFAACPSLPALSARYDREEPRYRQHGIHVMASQNALGEMSIGDTHHYGVETSAFSDASLDALVLDYLHEMLDLPGLQIGERWAGVYAKLMDGSPFLHRRVAEGVEIFGGFGGLGMTMAFGCAEELFDRVPRSEVQVRLPSSTATTAGSL